VFVLECVAPPKQELARFLPPTPLSILLRQDGKDVAKRPPRLLDGPAWQLTAAQEALAELVPDLLETARAKATAKVPAIRDQARKEMREQLGAELARLRHLRKVNDHVRPEELDALERRMTDLDKALTHAELRLDAVLLIMPA
jgi:ATP-dependent helicase HepA